MHSYSALSEGGISLNDLIFHIDKCKRISPNARSGRHFENTSRFDVCIYFIFFEFFYKNFSIGFSVISCSMISCRTCLRVWLLPAARSLRYLLCESDRNTEYFSDFVLKVNVSIFFSFCSLRFFYVILMARREHRLCNSC